MKENWKHHLTSDNTSWSALHSMGEVTVCCWVNRGNKFLFWNICRSCMSLHIFIFILLMREQSFFSFFLCWSSLISSILHLPSIPFAINASSLFMYFWALNIRSVIIVGGVFPREKTRSGLFNPTWKVVTITWLFATSISNTALLKCFTYFLRVSPYYCFIISRCKVSPLWHWPPNEMADKRVI